MCFSTFFPTKASVSQTEGRRFKSSFLNWNPLQPPLGCNFAIWAAILAEIFERSHVSGQGVAEAFIDAAVRELDLALPANTRTFLAEALMRWIHLYRLQQGESKILRHVLVLEEAHNILSPRADSGVENLYRELRSFGH